MGKLKNQVMNLTIDHEILKDFKISLVNKINFKRETIKMECEDDHINYGNVPDEVWSGVFEFPAILGVEILSELGYPKEVIKMTAGNEFLGGNHYESYWFYDFDEIWDFIVNLEEKDFLLAMILISSSNSQWNSITTINQLIIRELNNFKIKIDYQVSTVFVAMSFGDTMQKAREAIIRVIEEYGYEPMLIDLKEHNNQIVPEIFNEIERSNFVIGDLTEQKRGVYLEIGYAMAKKKQVILTVNTDDFDKNHFDIRQINTIKWVTENDLEKKLRSRIKAMHLQNF